MLFTLLFMLLLQFNNSEQAAEAEGQTSVCGLRYHVWHAGTKNISGKKRRHININYRDRIIWQQINFKKELSNIFKNKLSNAEKYLLKVHDEDPLRNDFLFKKRNNFFIKKFMKLYWDLKSQNF